MSEPFRVALSGDFRKADGSPVYPDFDLEPLRQAPGVEFAYLEPSNPIRAEQARGIRRAHPPGASLHQGQYPSEWQARGGRAVRRRLRHGRRRGLHQRRHRARDHARRGSKAGGGVDHGAPAGADRQAHGQEPVGAGGRGGLCAPRRAHGRRPRRAHAGIGRNRQYRRRAFPAPETVRHEADCARSLCGPKGGGRARGRARRAWKNCFAGPTSSASVAR